MAREQGTELKERTTRPGLRGAWRRGLVVLIISLLLIGACYAFRAPLLRGAANAWIVDDKLEKADAIIVLGGGVDYRPAGAARLYKQGLAPKILIMDVELRPTDKMELTPPEKSVTRKLLVREGVADDAIETVGKSVSSTYEESLGVKEWATQHQARRLIVATELFHTRRAAWLFRKTFRRTGVQVQLSAVHPGQYTAANWWQKEDGLINFQNEWFKLPYYWFKY